MVTDLAGDKTFTVSHQNINGDDLSAYSEFLSINLRLANSTIKQYVSLAKEFLSYLGNRSITEEIVRGYLKNHINSPASTYANRIKGLRHFLRDWLEIKGLAERFKFPEQTWHPPLIPTIEELRIFYKSIPTLEGKAAFILWATTGKRKSEIISLTRDRIDIEKRIIIPYNGGSKTKKEWYSVFNEECYKILRTYLQSVKYQEKIFSEKRVRNAFEKAIKDIGIRITPQRLRDWFCQTMGEKGVPDRYVDAFCGRSPKSVLARHYSDYSPERLKKIYDKAGLKILP
jgi:integrase